MLQEGELGIHPPGSLGVAFFAHTQAECIIGRSGDGITDLLKLAGSMRLDDRGTPRILPLRNRVFSNLLEADALNRTPELLFVCCNPNQLGLLTGELTAFLENLAGRGRLSSIDDIRRRAPILLILPNGILAEQTIQTYEEQLRESVLMRRLPGVTPEMVDALLDRLVRGISLQAGGRRGSGADTTYILERKGSLIFAGGGELERERVEAILTAHNYPFKHAHGVPDTRVEFDKAMISIVLNVGGLIHMVKDDGDLIDLRMGDLCEDPSKQAFIQRVTRAVFDVGRATGAYPPDADCDAIWAPHRATIMAHVGHMTSSVKTFRDALVDGLAGVKLFSNEEWILNPLGRYAAKAGMSAEEGLFRSLKNQVQEAMARAIQFREQDAGGSELRARTMKLIAQRNFTVEMYDAGSDNMVLIGSMLDDEHLIKLEVNIHLPNEQITRSRLDMIRVPFPVCREVEATAESLVGLRIERGVMNEIARRTGGRAGCSHIKELATNIVYFAASHLVRRRSGVDPMNLDYAFKPPEERFVLTKELLRDSCLAYCQTTPRGLDKQIGIRRVGEEHAHALPLGTYEPSLGVLLQDRTARWGDKTLLRYRVDDHICDLSWNETASLTWQIARNLIDQGIRPGDRICMLSENRYEMYVFELAVMSIGAVAMPIFAGYPSATVAYVLGHARPRFVVVSGKHQLDKIEKNKHPWIEQFYCMDFNPDSAQWGALDFATLTAEGGATPDELTRRVESVEPDDLCVIMYTSGTTGPPKGVQLSHRNLISQQKAISLIWDVDERDAALSYLPWHHSFGGLFERCLALYHGCELCIDDSRGRDMDRLIENWRAFNPTLFFSVPRVHDLLVARCRKQPELADAVLGGRLRFVFTAGASLPAHVETAYRERNIPVLEGWGLTETSPCATVTTLEGDWRGGYVGLPIPGVSIRIDSDQEILVKGPNVMAGYLDDEDATARVFEPDGWFRTGDLGEFTPNGLRLFGRRDGAFKLTTGEKVHPQRIEGVLVNESPYISAAVAVGSGKDFVGILIYPDFGFLSAWATKHGVAPDNMIAAPAVRELFAAELERINPLIEVPYQRVRRAVLLNHDPSPDRGELTPTGKLVRKAVMGIHQHAMEGMFAPDAPADVVIVPQPKSKKAYAHAS